MRTPDSDFEDLPLFPVVCPPPNMVDGANANRLAKSKNFADVVYKRKVLPFKSSHRIGRQLLLQKYFRYKFAPQAVMVNMFFITVLTPRFPNRFPSRSTCRRPCDRR